MDASTLDAALHALAMIADPYRLMMLCFGVVLGLIVGILPGIGGLAATALLLAIHLFHGPVHGLRLSAGTWCSDSDWGSHSGDPVRRPGRCGIGRDGAGWRATGPSGRGRTGSEALPICHRCWADCSGAAILALSIPVFRPMMRYIQSPELLAFSVFGLSMVAALAGRSPLRGLTAACVGLMIAMIGADPKTGEMRWTLDSLYLYDGLPLLPMILGLFALPELCDLAISRQSISAKSQV